MKKSSTLFLKLVILLLGSAALAFCIFVIPPTIGSFSTQGYDPILAGLYLPAVPFFIALYKAFKLLTYIDNGQAFSDLSVKALKAIKYCGVIISALFIAGIPYIFTAAEKDDAPGVVALGLIIIFASFVIAVFAAVLESLLKNAIELKSENDLTV
ncbi:MAG: DUF2975 domain-containing protein [Candidatus Doudnabacteria bacterium]|nr:DUF2975 domain-containing protein [Candidatus Doudnabacteria bacterium]